MRKRSCWDELEEEGFFLERHVEVISKRNMCRKSSYVRYQVQIHFVHQHVQSDDGQS